MLLKLMAKIVLLILVIYQLDDGKVIMMIACGLLNVWKAA